MNERFAARAARLAGLAGVTFGWPPDAFWAATPAELAALVRAITGDGGAAAAVGTAELRALMEACPDG